MKQTENQILIIFGASGDLTKRKLIPALYDLFKQNLLPEKFAVLGASRSQLTDDEFRAKVEEFLPKDENLDSFKKMLFYQPVLTNNANDLIPLKNRLQQMSADLQIDNNFVFYLSTPPSLYEIIPRLLFENGLSKSSKFFRRLIVEKPFDTATVHQGYIEPHNVTALWNRDGQITIWTSTQGSFSVRQQVADLLRIPASRIKVIPMEIGGGFGGKISVYMDPLAVLLSKTTGQPVKMVMDRASVFEATGPTAGAHFRIKMGADDKGKLIAA
ncbi:MAG: molybdopterin-dependent oxidoreductase, partial [Draconibacterium sp.]|nr:molybdopterin-dependent oxidoreductase [Draconibacterium sp.]